MGHSTLVGWATDFCVTYFNNQFASRMRFSNSGAYESPYGPAPMNGRRNDLIFFCKSTPSADWPSSTLGGNESFFFLEIYFRMNMGNMNFLTMSIICNLVSKYKCNNICFRCTDKSSIIFSSGYTLKFNLGERYQGFDDLELRWLFIAKFYFI